MRRRAKQENRQLLGAEKKALLYTLCEANLSDARRLSDFIGRALARMKQSESVLTLGHLVERDQYYVLHDFLTAQKEHADRLKSETLYLVD